MDEMERSARLRSQLKEAYAKVLYTYQTQQEAANIRIETQHWVSLAQIILTSLISVGFIGLLFPQTRIATCFSAALGVISLCLNIYTRSARNEEIAKSHTASANQLWSIVQDYISLLTDFDDMDLDDVKTARSGLQDRTEQAYSQVQRTSNRAYKRARKALKKQGAQSFDANECEKLLPVALREE